MRLAVSLDLVAALRAETGGCDPDPVAAAQLAELAGAHAVAARLRADRRHVAERDLYLLKECSRLPLLASAGPAPDALKVMKEVRPDLVTLGPDGDGGSAGGALDLVAEFAEAEVYAGLFREADLPFALRVRPETEAVKLAAKLAPRGVELDTGPYARAASAAERADALRRLGEAARLAVKLKLEVRAGGGLDYRNAAAFAAAVPEVAEAVVGRALAARAAFAGLDRAVRDMRSLLSPG